MAEKKKILYIVEAMGGGVFTYIVDLANELVNKYDMYIAYAVRKQTPKNYKDYFDKRIHLIEVKNFRRAIDPMKDIAAFFEVKKIAAEIKPDIIHLHSSKAGAIGRMAFNGKIPMFYTPHGYSFLMENYKPMKRRMFKLIESVCAKRNCTTISCSVGEHQESLKLTKHATYVNNGINMAELQEIIDKTEKVEHSFTVYTLGRICYQKNPTLFNEIAESLPDVKFVWIGDGELRDQLTSENIEITGWADRSTAIRYAVNADVFLLPSRWEGLPISLLESMYMKKACVVSNVIGNRDVIHSDIYDTYFQQYVIGKLYAVVGMRYHSNIFSAKMGTPFVSISYEQKMKGFMEKMGLPQYCIPVESLTESELKSKFNDMISAYEEYKNLLENKHEAMLKQAYSSTEALLKILEENDRRS